MNRKTGGTVCAVKGCNNTTHRGKDVKFFRFPKEPKRAISWALACNRHDLVNRSAILLYNSYRICSAHFDKSQYTSEYGNRLLPTAVPKIFSDSEDSSREMAPLQLKYSCKAPNCQNKYYTDSDNPKYQNLHFFRFPKNLEHAQKWAQFVKIADVTRESYYDLVLCEAHFQDADFTSLSKTHLKASAIPTIHAKCVMPTILLNANVKAKSSDLTKGANRNNLWEETRISSKNLPNIIKIVPEKKQPQQDLVQDNSDDGIYFILDTNLSATPILEKKQNSINILSKAISNKKIVLTSDGFDIVKCDNTQPTQANKNADPLITDENITTLCRVCLQQTGNEDLFGAKYLNTTLKQMFEKSVSIKLENDNVLTTRICSVCKKELVQSYLFVNKCLNSEKLLQSYRADKLTKDNNDSPIIVDLTEEIDSPDTELETYVVPLSEKTNAAENMKISQVTQTNIPLQNYAAASHPAEEVSILKQILHKPKVVQPKTMRSLEESLIDEFHSYAKPSSSNELKEFLLINDNNTVLEKMTTDDILGSLKERFPKAKIEIRKIDDEQQKYIRKKPPVRRKSKPAAIPCEQCLQTFSTKALLVEHCKTNKHFPIYKCPMCPKTYPRKYYFDKHMRTHNTAPIYICDRCGLSFQQMKNLKYHIKSKHEAKTLKHTCLTCGKAFLTNGKLNIHMRTHTLEKPYCCEKCGMVFGAAAYLRQHQKTHSGLKPFVCIVCNKGFVSRKELNYHMPKHTGERKYSCDHCGIAYKRSLNLRRHNRRHHNKPEEVSNKENSLPCNECDFVCASSAAMKLHMRRNHKLYTCTTCHKTFQKYLTFYHHKIKHRLAKSAHISCSFCGKTFPSRAHLNIHVAIHTGEKKYQCEICCKKFTQRHHLQSHILVHTGGRPYKCKYCVKAFAHQTTLVVHERSHTGETPYVCEICSRGFTHMTNHKKHMLTKHGIKIERKKTVHQTIATNNAGEDQIYMLDTESQIIIEEVEIEMKEEIKESAGHFDFVTLETSYV